MIALDEDALVCDFAETYHILNYRQIPAGMAATLASGLRDESRIKMKISGLKYRVNTLLLARIADSSAINAYLKTKDAKTGKNPPKSIISVLMNEDDQQLIKYENGKDFEDAWRKINGNGIR
jgi:hypothetical protein